MPELPEVETIRSGIAAKLISQTVTDIIIRQSRLRWPIPDSIHELVGNTIEQVTRRGKYLLLTSPVGTALLHLGMSGRLHIVPKDEPVQKHAHVDLIMANGMCLRFTDPRRFGSLLWTSEDPMQHFLLARLGVEPLTKEFTGEFLFTRSRKRTLAIKQFLMDSHIVVGIGNIYANEALFLAGIHPQTPAGLLSLNEYEVLVNRAQYVLKIAIKQGGTTLRDFSNSDGKPGYFKQKLQVYGRADMPCSRCKSSLIEIRMQSRTTVYCPSCQVKYPSQS